MLTEKERGESYDGVALKAEVVQVHELEEEQRCLSLPDVMLDYNTFNYTLKCKCRANPILITFVFSSPSLCPPSWLWCGEA